MRVLPAWCMFYVVYCWYWGMSCFLLVIAHLCGVDAAGTNWVSDRREQIGLAELMAGYERWHEETPSWTGAWRWPNNATKEPRAQCLKPSVGQGTVSACKRGSKSGRDQCSGGAAGGHEWHLLLILSHLSLRSGGIRGQVASRTSKVPGPIGTGMIRPQWHCSLTRVILLYWFY